MDLDQIQKSLPESLAAKTAGCAWREITIGESASKVFRLKTPDETVLYLKITENASFDWLLQEKLKIDWLQDKLPVPKPLMFVKENDINYFLISEIRGVNSSDNSFKENAREVIKQLAYGLKLIHELPIGNCPFDARLDYKIEIARERMINGLVEEEDFDEERLGRTAEDLFHELLATKPTNEDLVFTHGDYCAPNIIIENGKLSGFVDWSGAGIADRYQDLALLTRSVWYNFGEDWVEYVFEIYGIEPDSKKIQFYRLLDEFF